MGASDTIILLVASDLDYFRIQQLEKDLFYYKKTSRDLKRKLREVLASQLSVIKWPRNPTSHLACISPVHGVTLFKSNMIV